MATKAAKADIKKPALYKMISYKGTSGAKSYTPLTAAKRLREHEKSIGVGFSSVIAGLNAIGATINSIAQNTQGLLGTWQDSIASQVKDANRIEKIKAKNKKLQEKRDAKKEKEEKDRRALLAREKSTKDPKKKKLVKNPVVAAVAKQSEGFLKWLGKIVGSLISIAILDWVRKNPEAVEKLVKTLGAIGKFIFKVVGFLAGMSLDGLTEFLENPISLKGFFGIFKFLAGAVPLFAGFAILKNPIGSIKLIGKVVGGIITSIKRLFGLNTKADKFKQFKLKKLGKGGNFFQSKTGKLAMGLGAGATAATAVLASGGTGTEAAGAGVGAAGGQMLGAKLGAATGIPGMGAVGGMIGTMAGGAVGKQIGTMIGPIVEPFKKWFAQISTIFNDVLKDIKEPLEEFFKTLGSFLSGILTVVEPHLPLITKIISTGLKVVFAPLWLGIKALTAVMKLFTGGGGEKKEEVVDTKKGETEGTPPPPPTTQKDEVTKPKEMTPERKQELLIKRAKSKLRRASSKEAKEMWKKEIASLEAGNKPSPGMAKGGWIHGPQSGYPVSLNGGRSVSFIGHGTEWVGRKAGGRAFVVPFNTPATKTNKGLTKRRLGEASRGGFALPSHMSKGGNVYVSKGSNVYSNVHMAQGGNVYMAKGGETNKPTGWRRWLAGAADQVTGGFFDFDKQGHSIYQAAGQLQKAGEIIESVKQAMTEQKAERLTQPSVTQINDSNPAVVVGEEGEDMPIIIPGRDELDSDKYIKPKYGLIAEFLTDPVEFM